MSLESVNNLRRRRSWIDKDMACMDNRMAERSTGRTDKFKIWETKETIMSIGNSMKEIMQMYQQISAQRQDNRVVAKSGSARS